MAKQRKQSVGREAIELLKDSYVNGDGEFENIWHIVRWLNAQHSYIRATEDKARAWDRAARLELADQKKSVTYPSRVIKHKRQAQPTADERRKPRRTRTRDTSTRVINDDREWDATVAQADATELERAQAAIAKAQAQLASTLRQLAG
jgi:hypothetical protein